MILEETSLMPPIPGLLALLSMLFAPAIELRYSCILKGGVSFFFLRPSQIGDGFFFSSLLSAFSIFSSCSCNSCIFYWF